MQAEGIDLSELDLSQKNLVEVELAKANFDNALLQKTDLSCAYLVGNSFIEANLTDWDVVGWEIRMTSAHMMGDIDKSIHCDKTVAFS